MDFLEGLPFKNSTDHLTYMLDEGRIEVIIYADGSVLHSGLNELQLRELELRVNADKMLEEIKIRYPDVDLDFLKSIPKGIGEKYLDVWNYILTQEMTPEQAYLFLDTLYASYMETWEDMIK